MPGRRFLFLFNLLSLVGLLIAFFPVVGGRSQVGAGDPRLGQGEYTGAYWPTRNWRKCRPEAVGMSSEKLLAAIEYASTPMFRTEGLLILRKGYIVGEAYFGSFTMDSLHGSYSMAKSVTSTLIGIALDKGLISGIDERLCRYFPEWDCDDPADYRGRITLRHALTLTTGLEWQEDWTRWDPDTNDALKMGRSGRFLRYMAQKKGRYPPGSRFIYSTGDPMLLSRVIQKAAGMSAFEFAKQNLFLPLNITRVEWESDLDGYTATAWGLQATVRDYAKFGYLFLHRGLWEDKAVVSQEWVQKATRTDSTVNGWAAYGYLWHVNLPLRLKFGRPSGSTEHLPADGFMAEGVKGQHIIVIPSRDLVLVRVADQAQTAMDLVRFLTLVLEAFRD